MSDVHDKTLAQAGAPAVVNTRYRVVRELGAGGMGFVHLAEDTKLPRQVAIKTIKPDLCANAEILKRIDRECKLHAKIGSHPHIVTLFDRLEEDGHISLVMEYVPGETLQDLLAHYAGEGRRLQWEQGVGIASQVLEALARIHANGIVHRDIKPSNILLARDDMGRFTAKLMDFGIARLEVEEDGYTNLTREGGSGPGTPLYMAPEQIDPKTFGAISPATDIYATGVMLYQIITGRPPFGGSLTEIFNGHLNTQPPPLVVDPGTNVPTGLADVLRKSLAKHPRDRFSTARDFREALDTLRGGSHADLPIATAASFDPSKTMSSSEATASGFEKGGTLLDTTTAGGTRGRKSSGLAVVAVAAVALIAAGGFAAFTLLGGKSVDKTTDAAADETAAVPAADSRVDSPADAGTASALDQLQQNQAGDTPPPEPTAPVSAAMPGAVDPAALAGGADPATLPAGLDPAALPPGVDPSTVPAGVSPDAGAMPPDTSAIPASTTPPPAGGSALDAFKDAGGKPAEAPEPEDAGASGSALDALLNNQAPATPDTAVNPPAPAPTPAPEPAPAPTPAPKPKPKPAATAPKPAPAAAEPAKPAPKADSGSSNPWGKVKVKSVEDRKVD